MRVSWIPDLTLSCVELKKKESYHIGGHPDDVVRPRHSADLQ